MRGLAEMEIEAVPELPEQWLVAHHDGDSEAFAKLVQRYRRPVFGYLVHGGVPESDRDDLFQEIFIKIHQRADQYDAARLLHPWFFTVVANTVRSYFTKKNLRSFFVWEPAAEDVKDPAPDSEARASAKETAAWLERAIAALPIPQREVLVLATIEDLPLTEVASILDMPLNHGEDPREARAPPARGVLRTTYEVES